MSLVAGSVAVLLTASAATAGSSPLPARDECAANGCVTILEVTGFLDDILASKILETLDQVEADPDLTGLVLQVDSPGSVVSARTLADLARRLRDSPDRVSAWVGPSTSQVGGGTAELVGVLDDTAMAQGAQGRWPVEQSLPESEFGPVVPTDTSLVGRDLHSRAARSSGLVDRQSPTLVDFLGGLPWFDTKVVERDGRKVREPVTGVRFVALPLPTEIMHTVASPSIAYLALVIGLGLLLFEFFTAGVGVAGLVGAGALLLGGYGVGALPHRVWAAVVLGLAMVAFAVDVQTGIPRFWTGAGLALFAVGSVGLYRGIGVPWVAVIVGILGMAAAMVSGMPSMVRARFGTPTIGRESMIGEMGEAISEIDPEGIVRIEGGLWRARSNRLTPLKAGDPARVVALDGLMLEVEPEEGGARDYRELRNRNPEESSDGGSAG